MLIRIIPLLFFLSFIDAQIALPTFQAVHKSHTTTSSNGELENIFGSATSFTLKGNNSWTQNYACTGWGDIDGNRGFSLVI